VPAKTKIALCVAVALGSAVPATTNAFARNVHDSPDWTPPLYGWDAHRPPAVGTYEGNAQGTAAGTRAEHSAGRQPNAPRRGY